MKRSIAELKHFEKLNLNVNGLPISERSHRLRITLGLSAVLIFRVPLARMAAK